MGYQLALEAAGAVIEKYTTFGSYQGTWIALLEDGTVVEGSYGSCSGCDAFEGEFGWHEEPEEKDGKYFTSWGDIEITKEEFDQIKQDYQNKLASFGRQYLPGQTKEEILAKYERKTSDEWAWEDDKEIYQWLKDNLK